MQQQPGQLATAQAEQPQQQPAPLTFAGTIIKDGPQYVLRDASGTTYKLDDQSTAKLYAGKRVRIVASLDTNSGTLHIADIRLISAP